MEWLPAEQSQLWPVWCVFSPIVFFSFTVTLCGPANREESWAGSVSSIMSAHTHAHTLSLGIVSDHRPVRLLQWPCDVGHCCAFILIKDTFDWPCWVIAGPLPCKQGYVQDGAVAGRSQTATEGGGGSIGKFCPYKNPSHNQVTCLFLDGFWLLFVIFVFIHFFYSRFLSSSESTFWGECCANYKTSWGNSGSH